MVFDNQSPERANHQVPDVTTGAHAQQLSQNTWSGMDQTTSRRNVPVDESWARTLNRSVQSTMIYGAAHQMARELGRTPPGHVEFTSPYDTLLGDQAHARAGARSFTPQDMNRAVTASIGDNQAQERPAARGTEKSPEQKLFDPSVSSQDKIKLAHDLAKQGVRNITGPDGKQYVISVQGTPDRAMVAIFGTDNRGIMHPMLRGIVNGDGSVSNQLGFNGQGVDFRGTWARRFDQNNPLISKEQPTAQPGQPVQPPEQSRPQESQRQPQRPQTRPQQGDRPAQAQPHPQEAQSPQQGTQGGDRPQTAPQTGEASQQAPGSEGDGGGGGGPQPQSKAAEKTQQATPAESTKPREVDSEFEYFRRNFKKLDKDNNDYITGEEVDNYLKENKNKLTAAEVTALTKLKQNISNLEKLHDDEMGFENDGVTRNDLNEGEKRMKAFEFAAKNFDQIDSDKDGFLSATELKKFAKSDAGKKLSNMDKASLDYLRKNISEIEGHSNDEWGIENDGITRKDLAAARKDDGSEGFRTRVATDTDQLPAAALNTPPAMKQDGRVTQQDFKDEALKLFDQLDSDKNGFLSVKELAAAVESNKYTGKDAQTVAALYSAQHNLEELSNDEWGDENDGVTKADLLKFDQLQKDDSNWRKSAAQASEWLTANDKFKTLDTDNDKFLSYREIDKALKAPDLSEADKANLEFLKKHYSILDHGFVDEYGNGNDGITLKDLDVTGDKTVTVVNGTLYSTYAAQMEATRDLYADKTDPLKSITPAAVRQGTIGDCYFESAVASLAATQPEAIQKMIKDNGDGTYTVTFGGDPSQPITVDAPTESEMGLYNRSGKDGVWANVLEKAYGKYCQENLSHRGLMNLGGGNTLPEGADGGEIFHGRAMSLLTGKGTDGDEIFLTTDATLRRKLTDAFTSNPKRPVIAGINNSVFWNATNDGFPVAHMYSVTDFDPNGPDGGTVTVRNPWGGADNSTSGTKKISLKEFRKNFSSITYTEK